jgi:hypothetical protein
LRTILVITLLLLTSGPPGRDDTNDFIIGFAADRVSHKQQNDAADEAKSLPAEFAARDAVLVSEGERARKDKHGVLEANAVLAPVAPGLGFVPLEQDDAANIVAQKL